MTAFPRTATIAGANGQPTKGGPFQDYNFTAYISNSVQTIENNNTMVMVNVGDLVLDGNATVAGASQHITILIDTDRIAVAVDVTSARLPQSDDPGIVALVVADRLVEQLDGDRPFVLQQRRQVFR